MARRHIIKAVFIGGKQIGVNCLRTLIAAKMPPAFVVANPTDTGKDDWHESLVKAARSAKLSVIVGKKVKDPDVTKRIKEAQPDIIFCIGATEIIPKEVLAIPPLGVLNIHPALLPKYRGRFSTAHAIFNGESHTGVTLHLMDAGIDTGPIILQKSFPITEADTGKTVYDTFTVVGTDLFERFLPTLRTGAPIKTTPQDESAATYYPMGLPGNGQIDWRWDGEKIKRFIRAMTFAPFPPPSFRIGDTEMVIVDKAQVQGYKVNARKQAPRKSASKTR